MKHEITFYAHTDNAAGGGLVRLGTREVESDWEKDPALEASGATRAKALEEVREECRKAGGRIFGGFFNPKDIL